MSWTWILTGLCIAGAILNIRKKRSGFLLWAGCNLGWVIVNINVGLVSQAALFSVYTVLSLYGFIAWRKEVL